MMEEDVPGELGLAIGTTFSVATEDDDGGHEIIVKQEPPDIILPPEVMEHEEEEQVDEDEHAEEDDDEERMFEDEAQVFPEDSEIVMQRAVSPPTYVDPTEERIQELALFYKEKFQLPDLTVALENCDKIWNTMKMIKNLQEVEDSSDVLPKTSSTSIEPKLIPYEPSLGNNNKALPDFRFSVKSKKKLYHCVTCGKEFLDNSHLHQHALEEHGIYVNPKRIYKPRADMLAKISSTTAASSSQVKINNETMSPIAIAPQIQTIIPVQAMQAVETMQQPVEPMITDDNVVPSTSISNEVKKEESQIKEVKGNPAKEKVKCVLCKRVCTDIVSHMRNYHKVGCLSSIITQCEIVVEPSKTSTEKLALEQSKPISVPEVASVDLNESLVVAVKKRKRNQRRWTINKKNKYRDNYHNLPVKNFSNGPYKCLICLGLYKTLKSFTYHKKLHRMRGETPENFDPSKCRFLNSPLRIAKGTQPPVEETVNPVPIHKETSKIQRAITESITEPTDDLKPELVNEDTNNSEGSSMDVDNDNPLKRPTCECGRSFRSSYTMFLHKAKCKKPMKGSNDTDSGLGISIKIKKNKNDSYEVVPRNTPTEECYKEPNKDSDASSNDSGMASVDLNNQRVNASDSSQFDENHSVLHIQVAEDDEEVNIEDDNSNDSNLNNVIEPPCTPDLVTVNAAEKDVLFARSFLKTHSTVPSLTSLCRKVLTPSKQQEQDLSMYRCETCKTYFKTKTELIDHAKKMKHDAKSHCPCGKDFKNLKYYNIHVRRFHPTLLKCSYCSTNFDKIEKYTEHECTIVEGPLFIEPIIQTQCLQCKTLVDLGEPFDKHMKTHMVDSTVVYHCFKCDLKFDNFHQRRMHFDKEHGYSVCRICGKLLHIDHIYEHEAYHDGLGHPCHTCRKTFSQKALLKKHIQNTHEPLVNKIIKCMVCSKSLKLKHFKKHMSVHLHTEICRKCNKCFKSDDEQKNLEDHVASDHPTDYPTITCDTCNTDFISDERYKEHCRNGSCKSDLNDKSILV